MADGYRITDTRQVSAMGVDGRFHDQIEVTYLTDHGHVGTVRVRKDQFDPQVVRDLIKTEVASLNTLHNTP